MLKGLLGKRKDPPLLPQVMELPKEQMPLHITLYDIPKFEYESWHEFYNPKVETKDLKKGNTVILDNIKLKREECLKLKNDIDKHGCLYDLGGKINKCLHKKPPPGKKPSDIDYYPTQNELNNCVGDINLQKKYISFIGKILFSHQLNDYHRYDYLIELQKYNECYIKAIEAIKEVEEKIGRKLDVDELNSIKSDCLQQVMKSYESCYKKYNKLIKEHKVDESVLNFLSKCINGQMDSYIKSNILEYKKKYMKIQKPQRHEVRERQSSLDTPHKSLFYLETKVPKEPKERFFDDDPLEFYVKRERFNPKGGSSRRESFSLFGKKKRKTTKRNKKPVKKRNTTKRRQRKNRNYY